MSNAVKSRAIKMGNSKGIRIPKSILEQLELGEEVGMSIHGNQLVVRPRKKPRADWERQFERMAERGDDRLLDAEAVNLTDEDETGRP